LFQQLSAYLVLASTMPIGDDELDDDDDVLSAFTWIGMRLFV